MECAGLPALCRLLKRREGPSKLPYSILFATFLAPLREKNQKEHFGTKIEKLKSHSFRMSHLRRRCWDNRPIFVLVLILPVTLIGSLAQPVPHQPPSRIALYCTPRNNPSSLQDS